MCAGTMSGAARWEVRQTTNQLAADYTEAWVYGNRC